MPSGWNKRPEVSEELVEQGWEPHPDYRDMIWTKGDCVWTLIDGSGKGVLENRKTMYAIPFERRVPAHVILAVCKEATAPCQEHGTACEPDDHFEPPTVGGEVV